jgi:hypothetical protein
MSEQLQIHEKTRQQIIRRTALHLASLLHSDMNGLGCIAAIQAFAKSIEEFNLQDCEPAHHPASPTKRVRAAAYVTPSGNWAVLGRPLVANFAPFHGEKLYSDKDMVEELFVFSPSGENDTRVCMVDIDLPLPVHNPAEVIQAAKVEEVAE